ncbi:exodeoxyribonuclease III [Acetobacter estunensis NRIC 0472]|uniref:Exodeoxyribonuclease III n=1 Tax=Acetobacter estunensis TaxID=104097 RepID=A0A967B4Y9_9PROT|nr:exodeoxyribonuclease III [Acetobacter estunensis]NHO53294.1 exodeoxyribonuclease III [Acetobacter estunensis]GBQ23555.1 exodeoxyribonuclease III [Acetobacter estunensis NRIC 0472]
MKIATWNVNSIRQRQNLVLDWLKRNEPDLLLLQEIKCEAHQFPTEAFEAIGYTSHVVGQKSYNGVATLARAPAEVLARKLPGLSEEEPPARFLEIRTGSLTVGNLYLPNGNSGGPAGFARKMEFFDALARHAEAMLAEGTDFILAGDYNVCPTDKDLATGALPPTDALVHPESRAAFRRLLWLGLTDAVRALHPQETIYTFWDYQAGAFRRDMGLRIDHMLLSPRIAERLLTAEVDRDERGMEQPSDHVPVVITLS